jgi:hypothetical protein
MSPNLGRSGGVAPQAQRFTVRLIALTPPAYDSLRFLTRLFGLRVGKKFDMQRVLEVLLVDMANEAADSEGFWTQEDGK